MFPWLFNIFVDRVVKEVKSRVREQGARIVYGGQRRWEVSQLSFADDTAPIADGREKLQNIVTNLSGFVTEGS